MKLYADTPIRRSRKVLGDLWLLAWTAFSIWLATKVYDVTMALAVPGHKIESAATTMGEKLRDAGTSADNVPMIGDKLAKQFGGAGGLRDEGLLDSALARPVNKHTYEGCKELADLAAAYGFGLARNHPFIDGNKRAAFLAVGVFLAINGHRLAATPVDAIESILALAAGSIDEAQFAEWIKRNLHGAADDPF